jgi:hypothetical protein
MFGPRECSEGHSTRLVETQCQLSNPVKAFAKIAEEKKLASIFDQSNCASFLLLEPMWDADLKVSKKAYLGNIFDSQTKHRSVHWGWRPRSNIPMDFERFCNRFQGENACFDRIRFESVAPTMVAIEGSRLRWKADHHNQQG